MLFSSKFLLSLLALVAVVNNNVAEGLNIVIAGGTGSMGRTLIPMLSDDITVLSRNGYLAAAPNRVTEVFGYLGLPFLSRNKNVKLRDWDGGDLLEIVGQDWIGWQEDALAKADVVINLVGGFTNQRAMATERIVRESFRVNPDALQISVSPTEEDIPAFSPGLTSLKSKRVQECEDIMTKNLSNVACLRVEAFRIEAACQAIVAEIEKVRS